MRVASTHCRHDDGDFPQRRFQLGLVEAVDREGRTIWIVDAHGYGKSFIVRAEEILTALLELERAIRVRREFDVEKLMPICEPKSTGCKNSIDTFSRLLPTLRRAKLR